MASLIMISLVVHVLVARPMRVVLALNRHCFNVVDNMLYYYTVISVVVHVLVAKPMRVLRGL